MKILLADDSAAFRVAVKAALAGDPDLKIVATAGSGAQALAKLRSERIDVVLLDLEMPDGDGISVLEVMREEKLPMKALVFASLSGANKERRITAMRLGACDFLAKPSAAGNESGARVAIESIKSELVPRLQALLPARKSELENKAEAPKVWERRGLDGIRPRAIVIASSTGGPMALEAMFRHLRMPPSIPVLLCQHMPANFTKDLASRLEELNGIRIREGEDGEVLQGGVVYVAPGDRHMRLKQEGTKVTISLDDGPRVHFVRPAADHLFISAARIFGRELAAFVLTGMGEDARDGAIAVKNAGGAVMIQNRESATVWGMPGAVAAAGAFDHTGTPDEFGKMMSTLCFAPRGK